MNATSALRASVCPLCPLLIFGLVAVSAIPVLDSRADHVAFRQKFVDELNAIPGTRERTQRTGSHLWLYWYPYLVYLRCHGMSSNMQRDSISTNVYD